jgi:hypothetical protein
MINATVAASCAVTGNFLKIPLPDWLYFPFKTRMGLKRRKHKAG